MPDPPFTIPTDGDGYERRYWDLFAAESFPSYETFWAAEVVPLTYRTSERDNIAFRPQDKLRRIGKTSEDVTVAQLHYTVMLNLGRVFDLLHGEGFDRYSFAESFVWLTGASDVGDELLQRRKTPGDYEAWDEDAGRRARREWRGTESNPLRDIRAYRNRLVHGRVVPEQHLTMSGLGRPPEKTLRFPRIERVNEYLDWRRAQDPRRVRMAIDEFQEARALVTEAWERVVAWAEESWQEHLLDGQHFGQHSPPDSA